MHGHITFTAQLYLAILAVLYKMQQSLKYRLLYIGPSLVETVTHGSGEG